MEKTPRRSLLPAKVKRIGKEVSVRNRSPDERLVVFHRCGPHHRRYRGETGRVSDPPIRSATGEAHVVDIGRTVAHNDFRRNEDASARFTVHIGRKSRHAPLMLPRRVRQRSRCLSDTDHRVPVEPRSVDTNARGTGRGLCDRPRTPHRFPRSNPGEVVGTILYLALRR